MRLMDLNVSFDLLSIKIKQTGGEHRYQGVPDAGISGRVPNVGHDGVSHLQTYLS